MTLFFLNLPKANKILKKRIKKREKVSLLSTRTRKIRMSSEIIDSPKKKERRNC